SRPTVSESGGGSNTTSGSGIGFVGGCLGAGFFFSARAVGGLGAGCGAGVVTCGVCAGGVGLAADGIGLVAGGVVFAGGCACGSFIFCRAAGLVFSFGAVAGGGVTAVPGAIGSPPG